MDQIRLQQTKNSETAVWNPSLTIMKRGSFDKGQYVQVFPDRFINAIELQM